MERGRPGTNPHFNRRPLLRPRNLLARRPLTGDRERSMASSLARLGAALPRARPRAAASVLTPGRWDAAALGASRRAALNGKSNLQISSPWFRY